MSKTTTRKIGDHVSGGTGDDHDTGTVTAIGGQCEDSHPMNRPGNVYVAWDSGVETWTPESVLDETDAETPVYVLNCTDGNIYYQEAYGVDGHPVYTDREEAEDKLQQCIDAWPEDAPVREQYSLLTYPSMADAEADFARLVKMD